MANISFFEVSDLSFIDPPISNSNKTMLCEVILGLTGLETDLQTTKIFISVEKNKYRNFIIYHKNKYHCDTSTIADYLVAVIVKQYPQPILHIFDIYS